MLKNIVILFIITIVLFMTYFVIENPSILILIAIDVFFILIYTMIKIRSFELMALNYKLEYKKRLELEQELLKEIDLSNSIIRHKPVFIDLMRKSLSE